MEKPTGDINKRQNLKTQVLEKPKVRGDSLGLWLECLDPASAREIRGDSRAVNDALVPLTQHQRAWAEGKCKDRAYYLRPLEKITDGLRCVFH